MAVTRFVRSHADHSTDSGFQFEFYCDRCGTGYQTRFAPAAQNVMSDVMDAASSVLGGFFSPLSGLGDKARSAVWEKAHDEAFQNAVQELMPYFNQCRVCGGWVDTACWQAKKQCCAGCLESMGSPSETPDRPEVTGRTCSECSAPVGKGKFCADCGAPVQQTKFCPECGVEASGKFCADCGCKL